MGSGSSLLWVASGRAWQRNVRMSAALGILGGTFDPPHIGHVAAATAAWKQLGLDQVLVVPAGQAPLRSAVTLASAADRVTMAKLAFADYPWAVVDDRETRREGISWSIDTARELAKEHPSAWRVWILGADQLARLDRWKEVEEICRLVDFAVLARDGISTVPPDSLAKHIKLTILTAPPVLVSSTALRAAIKRGDSSRNGLPSGVSRHIDERSLYQA
ncbi:MAG: nicotinate (nicotinamide) nucleotide adenylyltransferase [Verrucomicrobia bacterium]|nr:nicotinate (nicotinamide) nucleotide adenylyltransferase [Verrucomicrobiota bacterium]NBS04500.1 nicotinate (nicotinamide) nucleotide adenylyltransferase [Verrucomicrobiota bacterium]NBY37693.1 nicotinate (nicotinamide) nucleotide adenylyltransferase [Verrucomicrobiota bacterium]